MSMNKANSQITFYLGSGQTSLLSIAKHSVKQENESQGHV